MKVLNTVIPAGLNLPTGKVGRKWTEVYIDNLGEFAHLIDVDRIRLAGGTTEWPFYWRSVNLVRQQDLEVHLISNGVVVAKGKLPG